MASSTSINLYSLVPEAQELLLRTSGAGPHTELIAEFLHVLEYKSVGSIAAFSVAKSDVVTSFTEFATARVPSNISPRSVVAKVAVAVFSIFIDACCDAHKEAYSSVSHAPAATPPPDQQLKRQSSSSSSSFSSSSSISPPTKKCKLLGPAKLLQLRVDHQKFWQYLILFTSLLDPAHTAEVLCPSCGQTQKVNNPHNLYAHIAQQHSTVVNPEAKHGCVVAAAPEFPPNGDSCHRELSNLSEHALAQVPLPWLAAMPIDSLPASIQARVRVHLEVLPLCQVSVGTAVTPSASPLPDESLAWVQSTSLPGLPPGMTE